MKNLFLLLFFVPALLKAQTPDTTKLKFPGQIKQKIKSAIPNVQQVINPGLPKTESTVRDPNAYTTLPWLHLFLDTASVASIYDFLNEHSDSVLQLVQYETLTASHRYFMDNPYSPNDKDGDGNLSVAAGGPDCDDLDNRSYPGNTEQCNGFSTFEAWKKKYIMIYKYHNEDCNPCTVAGHKPDGDEDMDNQKSSSCMNYYERIPFGCDEVGIVQTISAIYLGNPGRLYTIRGWDCDDRNPALIRAAQICVNERTIAVCEKGIWRNYPCTKCVTQANGSGVVVE